MMEPLGVTASVAGVLGLAGQILNGCLCLKDFIDHAKSAPKDVLDLYWELESIVTSVTEFKSLVGKLAEEGLLLPEASYQPALEQCFEAVGDLKTYLLPYAKRFAAGDPRLRDNVKVAGSKSTLEKHLTRLCRTKHQLQIVQSNLLGLSLQSQHQLVKETKVEVTLTRESLLVMNGGLETLQQQGHKAMESSQRIQESLLIGLEDLNRQVKRLDETISSSLDVAVSPLRNLKNSVERLPSFLREQEALNRNVWHWLGRTARCEYAQDRNLVAIGNGLEAGESPPGTSRTQRSTPQASSQRPQPLKVSPGGWGRSPRIEHRSLKGSEGINQSRTDHTNGTHMPQRARMLATYEHQLKLERRRILHKKMYSTPMFDLVINRSERLNQRGIECAHGADIPWIARIVTTYLLHIKLPFFKRRFNLERRIFEEAYSSNLSMTLRTSNIVSRSSPQFKACLAFDASELQRLFASKLATPFDYNEHSLSLIDLLCYNIFLSNASDDNLSRALETLKFLMACLGRVGCTVMPELLRWSLWMLFSDGRRRKPEHVEALRLIVQHSVEDPFHDLGVARLITIEYQQDPVQEIFMAEEHWPLNWDCLAGAVPETDFTSGYFRETDFMMVKDPEAQKMQEALSSMTPAGFRYQIVIPQLYYGRDLHEGTLHSLLGLAARSGRQDLRYCCQVRIVLLLGIGKDPRGRNFFLDMRDHAFVKHKSLMPTELDWQYPKSPTGCAIQLEVLDLWILALKMANWTQDKIYGLLDEEAYLGIPQLLSGSCTYMTRGECRTRFVLILINGGFLKDRNRSCDWRKELAGLEWHLGLNRSGEISLFQQFGDLYETIQQADTAYRQQSMPGSWNADEYARFVPGIDFNLPEYDCDLQLIN